MSYAVPAAIKPPVIAECYQSAVAITPTDNAAIGPFAGLYVGTGGDVTLVPVNSTTPVLFKNLPAGLVLRVSFQGVNASGTTASNLVGLG